MPENISFDFLAARVESLLAAKQAQDLPLIIALDGGCGCGKTTLAERLARRFERSATLHTDDYYLPPEKRAANWQRTPCANMDLERLRREALEPLSAGTTGYRQAYCCGAGCYRAGGPLVPQPLVIVEGSYSLHPTLSGFYGLRVFVTCAPEQQAARLKAREGGRYAQFAALWVPLEETYFEQYGIKNSADFIYDTTV